MFSAFPNIEHVNISHNPIIRFETNVFKSSRDIRLLDAQNCPIVYFPPRIFAELHKLHTVFADNYKLCCSANLPDNFNVNNCHAPEDEISSCNALLRADVFRIFLSLYALCSLMGNALSVIFRLFLAKGKQSSFKIFIINLCLSDFIMGIYLSVIGLADRVYMDNYLWEEINWRHSLPCQLAGFLSLLSSETSAIIICLVTLDRFLVIRFPFSNVRFGPTSATVACIITWCTGCILAVVPLLHRNWAFYSQTGICIPLPTTQIEFAGRDYIFGVVIVFNFALFLIIASGQTAIYLSILANQMTAGSSTKKSQDVKVARHLITVAVSDFLCWFPIGLLGLLASEGVAIPGVINVILAIIVLPLNAALNPFLYNLNVILDKRNKAKEKRLKNEIMEELEHDLCQKNV